MRAPSGRQEEELAEPGPARFGQAKYGERTYQLALDFLDAHAKAEQIVHRGKAAFDSDEMLQLASEAVLTRLREVTNRLKSRKAQPGGERLIADTTPDIDWDAVRGMGNRTAHDYDGLDYEIVWSTMTEYLPKAARSVRRAIGE